MALEAGFGEDVKINVVKLFLGIMVVFYDILFIVQHYCIYPTRREHLALVSNYDKPALTSETLTTNLIQKNEQERAQGEGPEAPIVQTRQWVIVKEIRNLFTAG